MSETIWIDTIPDGWEIVPLKSKFTFGKGLSITKADLVENGLPVLSYGQIHSKYNSGTRIDADLLRYVPKAIVNSSPDSLAEPNGFIFADTSEDLNGCGNCCYVDRSGIYSGYHTIVIKPDKNDNTDNHYLAYLFQTDAWRFQIRRKLTEVKVFSVSQNVLKGTSILVPPADEQKAIVDFLDSKCAAIDESIYRHNRTIEKLNLLKSKTIGYAITHGINTYTSKKIIGDIGTCPSHWKVSRLKFAVNIVRGGSPRPIEQYITEGNGYNWIKIGDATGNGKYINSTKQRITEDGLSKTRLVYPGTLLLTNSMSFGHPYILNITGCIHDGWLAFSDYRDINQDYLYYYLMSDNAMNQFVRTVEGSVVNNLNIDKVKNSIIAIPPLDEQNEIVNYLEQRIAKIDKAISTKENIVSKLVEYRKSLIYHAVTGKIDCKGAV